MRLLNNLFLVGQIVSLAMGKKLKKQFTVVPEPQNLAHVYSVSDTELKHKMPQPSKFVIDKRKC